MLSSLIGLAGFGASSGKLQAQEYLYELGGSIGWVYYNGDAARLGPATSPGFEVSFVGRYNINFRWALSGELSFRNIGFDTRYADNSFPENKTVKGNNSMGWLGVMGEFNFLPYSNKFAYLQTSRISPYVGLGAGLAVYPSLGKVVFAPAVQVAAGVKFKITDRWDIAAYWRGAYLFDDRFDAPKDTSAWLNNPYKLNQSLLHSGDGFGGVTVSLTYNFGQRQGDCTKKEKRQEHKPLKFKTN